MRGSVFGADSHSVLAQLIDRVDLRRDGIQVTVSVPLPGEQADTASTSNELVATRFMPIQIRRRGMEMRMIVEAVTPARVDRTLLNTVARAYRWSDDLLSGRVQSIPEIAKREGVTARYVWRLIRVGFLAPTIVEAIIDGRQPEDLTSIALTTRLDLPTLWTAQEQALGIA